MEEEQRRTREKKEKEKEQNQSGTSLYSWSGDRVVLTNELFLFKSECLLQNWGLNLF